MSTYNLQYGVIKFVALHLPKDCEEVYCEVSKIQENLSKRPKYDLTSFFCFFFVNSTIYSNISSIVWGMLLESIYFPI